MSSDALRPSVDRKAGLGKPETFSFLGFTHYCGETRKGAFTIKRQSMAKRMGANLLEIKAQLKRRLHSTVARMGVWLRSVVGGGWATMRYLETVLVSAGSQRGGPHLVWRFAAAQSEISSQTLAVDGTADSLLAPPARIVHPYPNERLAVT